MKMLKSRQRSRIMQLMASCLFTLLLIFAANPAMAQDEPAAGGNAATGKELFRANCASCHSLTQDLTGPALDGVMDRVPGGDWIYRWIHNSRVLVAEGDPYAVEIDNAYPGANMMNFPNLTNEQIDDILAYIQEGEPEAAAVPGDGGAGAPELTEVPELQSLSTWIRFLIFIIVILLLAIAGQVAKLAGPSITKNIDWNKLNARLMLGFLIFGLIGAFWSIMAYKDTFIFNNAASEHGDEIDTMFWITMTIAMLVFVVTNILLMFFAYKYAGKEGRKAHYYPENHKLELIWTVVPAIVLTILVVLGIRTWTKVMSDPPEGPRTEVEITGEQFAWYLRYPGMDNQFGDWSMQNVSASNFLGVDWNDPKSHDDIIADTMYLPKGRPVVLTIRAKDVLHSVYLPHFRVKMDAVPGMPTRFWFVPTVTTDEMRQKLSENDFFKQPDPKSDTKLPRYETFNYELACTELCGRGHFSMRKLVYVVEPEVYDKWVARQKVAYDPSMATTVDAGTTEPAGSTDSEGTEEMNEDTPAAANEGETEQPEAEVNAAETNEGH